MRLSLNCGCNPQIDRRLSGTNIPVPGNRLAEYLAFYKLLLNAGRVDNPVKRFYPPEV